MAAPVPLGIDQSTPDQRQLNTQLIMEDLLLDLELFMQCDMEVCPPPIFDLPPPPPPPWMDMPPDCGRGGCGNAPHVSSLNHVQEIFHSISIIIVCSLIIVITIMLAALLIWR